MLDFNAIPKFKLAQLFVRFKFYVEKWPLVIYLWSSLTLFFFTLATTTLRFVCKAFKSWFAIAPWIWVWRKEMSTFIILTHRYGKNRIFLLFAAYSLVNYVETFNVLTSPITIWLHKGQSKHFVELFFELTPIKRFYVVHFIVILMSISGFFH